MNPDVYCHPTSLVESEAVGAGTRIWAFAHVMNGAVVGRDVNIGDHVFVESGSSIGDNATIKNAVCIWDGVTIEEGVFVGPRVTFTNDRCPRSPRLPLVRERYSQKDRWLCETVARAGCSIGAAATIGPGVTLGVGCMVGAGATVTRDVPPFALVVGTPARQIGDVCGCGERLQQGYDVAICPRCGQIPGERLRQLPEFVSR